MPGFFPHQALGQNLNNRHHLTKDSGPDIGRLSLPVPDGLGREAGTSGAPMPPIDSPCPLRSGKAPRQAGIAGVCVVQRHGFMPDSVKRDGNQGT